MKTKILYVLVSSEKDFYLEQAYISMYSAKFYMQNVHIVLLVDDLTEQSFVGKRKGMLRYADEVVVVKLDKNLTGKKRSRMLKTSFRKYVNGDVLFIDCDTIIVRSLDEIDNHDNNIEVCRDLHTTLQLNPVRDSMIQRDMKLIGCQYNNNDPYYNSGVMYVKDNEISHKFFSSWYDNYMKGYEKGVSMDQPSLAITNVQQGYVIKQLYDSWNCQLCRGVKYLNEARIIHYLGTNKSDKDENTFFSLCNASVILKIKESGEIPNTVKEVVANPFKGIPDNTVLLAGKDVEFKSTLIYNFFHTMYLSNLQLFGFCNTLLKCVLRIARNVKQIFTINISKPRGGVKQLSQIFVMQPFAERRAA